MAGMFDNSTSTGAPQSLARRSISARNQPHQTARSKVLAAPGAHPLAALAIIPTGLGTTASLWKILAALGGERRWLAWISPPQRPNAAALAARGLDPARMLVIQAGPDGDPLIVAERALASGNFTAVLAWPGIVDAERLARFQQAAISGKALGILFPATL